ncbi:CD151 antigen-like isoform X1 [Zophobas morio]|uniref:CD151 antigen-like isoform X1 n=2 Tax=Zophobas morio TaxID=2755281 RepID=UPI003082A34C
MLTQLWSNYVFPYIPNRTLTKTFLYNIYIMPCRCDWDKLITCTLHIFLLIYSFVSIALGSTILDDESQGIPRVTTVSIGAFAVSLGVLALINVLCCIYTLRTYYVSLVPIIILQIVLGGIASAVASNNDSQIYTVVKKVFDDYVHNQQNEYNKEKVDTIQQYFHCCGVQGPQYWSSAGLEYPDSCYSHVNNDLYFEGCVSKFQESVTGKFRAVGGISIAFALTEAFGTISLWILGNRNSEESQRLLD